jgi:hypothetical protein
MKSVRLLSLLLAVLMLLPLFTACGNNPAETTAPADTKPGLDEEREQIRDTVPPDLNYNGETVNFFVRSDQDLYKYELACDELLNNSLYDAIHYRNIDVESRLGVSIKTIAQDGRYSARAPWSERLATSVLTNSGDYDGAAFYLSTGSALAKDGIYYNLLSLTEQEDGYLNLEQPWWNQSLVEELGYYGTLFFIGGSLTISQAAAGYCLFFNRDMFNEKFPEESDATLYQLVRDGKWTADRLANYVSQVWTDVNSNGVIDDGDIVGTYSVAGEGGDGSALDAWIPAMGLKLTEHNQFGEIEIALFNSRIVPAYEKIRSIFGSNPGTYLASKTPALTAMPNGNVLFCTANLDYGTAMRESSVNYGVLPATKFDENQENYQVGFANIASALAVCSNLSADRAAMVSAVLEVLSAESYKQVIPVYYGTILKGQYSREQADAEMYDLILKSFAFTFGFAYSSFSLGSMGNIFRNLSPTFDIQEHIDTNRDMWKAQLEELLLALEEVA